MRAPAHFTARETLVELYRPRFARLRGEAPGGNWVGIEDFGLPLNETQSDACRLQPQHVGAAWGVSLSPPAATNQE